MNNNEKDRLAILREKAESLLRPDGFQFNGMPPAAEIREMLHDLHTHQIELTLQNEELQETYIKLEESRAQYMDLYEQAPVGYFTFDDKGLVLAANLTGCRQMGQDKGTLLNQPFTSFLSQDDSDLFYLHLQEVFKTGNKQACFLTIFQKNNNPFYARLDSILVAIPPGKVLLCRTTITDINESKELEEELKISETRYRRLFEAAREGILILDAETGQITDVNPFLIEMLGYSHAELLGKKLWEIGCFKDKQASQTAFEKLREQGYVRYDDLPLETKNGRVIAVEFISTLYLVNNHRVIQCYIRDITRRKLEVETLWQPSTGKERRLKERRAEPQMLGECLDQKKGEHQKSEEALRKALRELKTLKERLVIENIYFHQEIKKKHQFDHIIGQSDGLKYVLYRAEQVAPTNATVLILGETGTGKELIAAAIHHLSPRKERPLMTVNCAALPANLLESELFGREKGAFTGSETRQIGRFEIANGSTLCLDEIGELPLDIQAKLLRVIQHGEFERLGSSKTIKVDVRIIATTNRNLDEEILTGGFRKDLFYRLNVFPITVPPLRQRSEDIPALVQIFVERYAKKLGKQITSIPKQTMKILQEYSWPGNIRELESIIERAVILCHGPGFQLTDKLTPSSESLPIGTLSEMEHQLIQQALSETKWRIEGKDGAAKILGLNPSTLRAKMHKFGIIRPKSKTRQ